MFGPSSIPPTPSSDRYPESDRPKKAPASASARARPYVEQSKFSVKSKTSLSKRNLSSIKGSSKPRLGNKSAPTEAVSMQFGRDFFKERLAAPTIAGISDIPGGKWLGRIRLALQASPKVIPPQLGQTQIDFSEAVELHEALLSASSRAGEDNIRIEGKKETIEALINKSKALEQLLNKSNKSETDKENIRKLKREIKSLARGIEVHIKGEGDWGITDKIFSLSNALNDNANWGFFLVQQIGSYASLGAVPIIAGLSGGAATSVVAIPISLFFLYREYEQHKKSEVLETKAKTKLKKIESKKTELKKEAEKDPTVDLLGEEQKLLRAMNKAILHKHDRTGRQIGLTTRIFSVISCCAYAFAGIVALTAVLGAGGAAGVAIFSNPIGLVVGTGLGLIAFTIFMLYYSGKTTLNFYDERKKFKLFKDTIDIADHFDRIENMSPEQAQQLMRKLYNQSSDYYKKLFQKLLDEYDLRKKFEGKEGGSLSIEEFKELNRLIAYKAMRKLVLYNEDFAAELLQRMLYAESLRSEEDTSERTFTKWVEGLGVFKDQNTIQHIANVDITSPHIPKNVKKAVVKELATKVFRPHR